MDSTTTPTESSTAFARGVGTLLKDQRYSIKAAAEATGIPYVTLRRKLSGMSDFDFREIAALAHLLELSPAQLVTEAERQVAA